MHPITILLCYKLISIHQMLYLRQNKENFNKANLTIQEAHIHLHRISEHRGKKRVNVFCG